VAVGRALEGGKALVCTIDPARRLANALGLSALGNVETRVPPEAFAAAGLQPRGELFAMMLDDLEMVLAKSDLGIFERYSQLAGPLHGRLYPRIAEEFERTRAGLLQLCLGDALPRRRLPAAPDGRCALQRWQLLQHLAGCSIDRTGPTQLSMYLDGEQNRGRPGPPPSPRDSGDRRPGAGSTPARRHPHRAHCVISPTQSCPSHR